MASLPEYIAIRFPSYGEGFDPSVSRVEMERGPAKQSIINTHVYKNVKANFLFKDSSQVEAFEAWYFEVIKRIGWFDMIHPRTGQLVVARFVGGDIGTLEPLDPLFGWAQRTVTMEFRR